MRKITDVLINGAWLTQQPTINGQRVRETTYFDDGTFGIVEYTFEDAAEVPDWRITKLAFKQRFTQGERIDIREASKTIPKVYDFEDLVNSATFIDLSRDDTKTAVNEIESVIPLTQGRANEILTAPIQEHERYRG